MKIVTIIVIAFVLLIPLTVFAQYTGNVGSEGQAGSYTLEEALEIQKRTTQSQYGIPSWVKGIAGFWAENKISDSDFGEGLSFLIDNEIIQVPKIQELEEEIIQLKAENSELRSKLNLAESTDSSSQSEEHSQACVGCSMDDAKETASEMLLDAISISIWTDKSSYSHNDMIKVEGQVAETSSGFPVTITVVSPENSIVITDQLTVAEDGGFETTLNTSGAMWKYDGTYTIKVNYGSAEKSNSAKVELTS